MTSIADGSVRIQTSAESVPSPPSWFGVVVLMTAYLRKQGVLTKIAERVRFARRRFGLYDVIDFLAVLFGYAISGERTLEVFYKGLQPFAAPFIQPKQQHTDWPQERGQDDRKHRSESEEEKRKGFFLQQDWLVHATCSKWEGKSCRCGKVHLPFATSLRNSWVKHSLDHRVKYARLVQRKASSPQAQVADCRGYRYYVQLTQEGIPSHKPKHTVGRDIIGADVGPSGIDPVPREAQANLELFCEQLAPDERKIRQLQHQMDRQHLTANPDNYDEQGRIQKHGKTRLPWKCSRTYQKIQRRKAAKERKLAAHRRSLHGKMVYEIVTVGNPVILEKLSYKA